MANILYAEDDRDCRELFAFALRQENHTVHEARNGAQAVQIVREEPIDLAILDVRPLILKGHDSVLIIAKEQPKPKKFENLTTDRGGIVSVHISELDVIDVYCKGPEELPEYRPEGRRSPPQDVPAPPAPAGAIRLQPL